MNQQFTEKEKNAARRAVRAAILSGKLVRPSTCSKCGTVPEAPKGTARAIHAHHTDYSRPLDVEWICAKCHRAETPLPEKMGAPVFGERNGQSKLTASDARAIRESPLGCRRLAKLYGVDKKTIQWVRNGTQWREAASPAPSEGGKGVDDTFARELYIASQCDVHNLHTLAWAELTEATRDEWRKKATGAAR